MNIKNNLAPIVVFAYNRPVHLEKTIQALLKNAEAPLSNLYIFSDGSKSTADANKVRDVRRYAKQINGFRSITLIERPVNYGLGPSIIAGVTEVLSLHESVIVLEDDLVTSAYFLKYMNEGLELYENDHRVASIHGLALKIKNKLPPTYFLRGADCLGWATWRGAWSLFEPDSNKLLDKLNAFDLVDEFNMEGSYCFTDMLKEQIQGKNNSWAVRWHASMFLENKLTLYPSKSLVTHIGSDGSGQNCGTDDMLVVPLTNVPIGIKKIEIIESKLARKALIDYFRSYNSLRYKVLRRLIKLASSIKENI